MRWSRRASDAEMEVIQCGAAGSTREALPERVALRVAGMTERVLLVGVGAAGTRSLEVPGDSTHSPKEEASSSSRHLGVA